MKRILFTTTCCLFFTLSGCASKKARTKIASPERAMALQPAKPVPKASEKPSPNYKVTRFSTAKEAFLSLVNKTDPLIIGMGELHQKEETAYVRSALVHFTEDLLPMIAPLTADLVVETWQSSGDCGETETETTTEVSEATERPVETESETVRLLRTAFQKNIQYHVLTMTCDDYQRILGKDGVDYYLLLKIVGERLGEEALKARQTRALGSRQAKPITVIYGGALHNDATPDEVWKEVTYGKAMVTAVGADKYLEVDLIVPEFAEASKTVQNEPWMPTVRASAAADSVALIELGARSYILVLPKRVPPLKPEKPHRSGE